MARRQSGPNSRMQGNQMDPNNLNMGNLDMNQLMNMLQNVDFNQVASMLSSFGINPANLGAGNAANPGSQGNNPGPSAGGGAQNMSGAGSYANNPGPNMNNQGSPFGGMPGMSGMPGMPNMGQFFNGDRRWQLLNALRPMVDSERGRLLEMIMQLYAVSRILRR